MADEPILTLGEPEDDLRLPPGHVWCEQGGDSCSKHGKREDDGGQMVLLFREMYYCPRHALEQLLMAHSERKLTAGEWLILRRLEKQFGRKT